MSQVADLKELTVQTQGFQGGLNMRDAVDQLQPNELARVENVVFDNAGGLAKRRGSRSMGTVDASGSVRVLSTYTFYRPGSNPQVLIHTTAGVMRYTSDVTANPITWTNIAAGLSTTQPASFETQNGKCYFAEGTVFGEWTGSAYSAIGAAPPGITYLRVWKDIMWACAVNADRLYSSSAGDPTTWPALNFVDIMHGDGDSLTGLASDGLFLIAAKRRRIQVVYDPITFANRTADWEKGAESHFCWLHKEDKLYFLSRLGACWWQGDASARLISYRLDPLFSPDFLNYNLMSKAMGYEFGDVIGFAVPEAGASANSLVLEYYPRLGPIYQISGNIGPGPWSMHRMPGTCFTTVRQGTVENVYGGSPSANKYMWLFSPDGTDDGVTVASIAETAAFNFGNPVDWKYFRRVTVVGRGKFTMQFKRNYGLGVYQTQIVDLTQGGELWNNGNWGDKPWGPTNNTRRKVLNTDLYFVSVSIVLSDSETTSGTQIIPVGSTQRSVTRGEWAFYQASFDGVLLGLRGD